MDSTIFGKFFTGYFAISFDETLNDKYCLMKIFNKIKDRHFQIVSFAMGCWGEFTFILASQARQLNIINQDTFSSIIVAALLSIVIFPYLLRLTLDNYNRTSILKIHQVKMNVLQNNNHKIYISKIPDGTKEISISHTHFGSELHPVHFVIDIKSFGKFGQSDILLDCIINKCHLKIIDYRSWHPHIQPHPMVLHEIYVKSSKLKLPPTQFLES